MALNYKIHHSVIDMLECELTVLSKIEHHMMGEFDKHQKNFEDSTDTSGTFWADINKSFLEYFKRVSRYYSGDLVIPEKKRRASQKAAVKKTEEELSSKADRSVSEKELQDSLHFYTCLDELKAVFNEVDKTYLLYSKEHRLKCKVLFSELLEQINAAQKKGSNHQEETDGHQEKANNHNVLGNISLEHMCEMIDIKDEEVVKLLPFLLTAYVYNFRENVFMQRVLIRKDETASIYDADKIDVSRICKNLKTLSTQFGFAGKKVKFNDTEAKENLASFRPSVFLSEKYPTLHDRRILNLVFVVWCIIFSGSMGYGTTVPNAILKNVDIWLCCKLYTYYTYRSGYGFLLKKMLGQRKY